MTREFENDRQYFVNEKEAEGWLFDNGYTQVGTGRYPYQKLDGTINADIRFNSVGIFIEYRNAA